MKSEDNGALDSELDKTFFCILKLKKILNKLKQRGNFVCFWFTSFLFNSISVP